MLFPQLIFADYMWFLLFKWSMVLNGVLSVFLQLSPVISSNQYTRVIGLYRSTFVSTIVHQTRLWLWRRWFELVFELLPYPMKSCSISRIWAGIWPMPRVNISKKCELGFPRKIIYKWCVLHIWVFRRAICCDDRKKLLMKEMTTWHCVMAICINLQDPSTFEPRLIQPPDCYSMWKDSPQPRPTKPKEDGKNTIFLLRLSTKSIRTIPQLPLQLASRVAGLAKTFPEVLSLSTMPPRLPRRTWNYVKLFVTFPWHCITLEVTWGAFFPGDVCSGTHNLPSCHFDGGNAHSWWVNLLLLYHCIPLGGILCFRAILWMRPSFGLDICWSVLRCSPISAVQPTEWRHTVAFQLTFCLALAWMPVLFFKKTRSKQILTGTQFGRRSLKCLGPEKSWNTVGTSAHQCASCLPVNGLHIAKNRSFQILHLQGVSKIQNWHAPAISRGLTKSHEVSWLRCNAWFCPQISANL